MKTRMISLCASTALLSGCSHLSKSTVPDFTLDEVVYEPASLIHDEAEVSPKDEAPETVIVERFTAVPMPGQLQRRESFVPYRAASGKSHETIDAASAGAKVGPDPEDYVNAIQVYPFAKGALYQIFTAPEQVTDIGLALTERLISVSAGDTENWILSDTLSGEGNAERVHILVKPVKSDLNTNLVITTSQRVYHAELTSCRGTYMAAVSWRYPQEILISLSKSRPANPRATARASKADITRQSALPKGLVIDDLKFRYEIKGDTPHWRPLRAFDDGHKVYIQFPARIDQGEAPPLFVVSSESQTQLVNYRVKGRYYIVDRLFARAELRLGEKDQQVVRIDRIPS